MKKGQAAMEFLMTYGWVILVIIAVGALWYFGVLNLDNYVPNRCVCNYSEMQTGITSDGIKYIECISLTSYLNYTQKRIRFNQTVILYNCINNTMIEV